MIKASSILLVTIFIISNNVSHSQSNNCEWNTDILYDANWTNTAIYSAWDIIVSDGPNTDFSDTDYGKLNSLCDVTNYKTNNTSKKTNEQITTYNIGAYTYTIIKDLTELKDGIGRRFMEQDLSQVSLTLSENGFNIKNKDAFGVKIEFYDKTKELNVRIYTLFDNNSFMWIENTLPIFVISR